MTTRVNVPELEIDKVLYTLRGEKLRPSQRLERRIVAELIAHMAGSGWYPLSVWDGEELTQVDGSAKAAMELIFNLDEASLRFSRGEGKLHGVLLVLGNGEDIISDWNYTTGDPDGFNAAMESFQIPEVN